MFKKVGNHFIVGISLIKSIKKVQCLQFWKMLYQKVLYFENLQIRNYISDFFRVLCSFQFVNTFVEKESKILQNRTDELVFEKFLLNFFSQIYILWKMKKYKFLSEKEFKNLQNRENWYFFTVQKKENLYLVWKYPNLTLTLFHIFLFKKAHIRFFSR